MTNLLLKIFVKNKNLSNSDERECVGKLASIVGIIVNMILALAKILVGTLFGIISVLADGLNNLTDCGSNVVSLISFKLSGKPADKEHPYGHARLEYVASMVVGVIVLIVSIELLTESVNKIALLFDGQTGVSPLEVWTVIALGASILGKLWLYAFNKKLGNAYNSQLLKATATDSISDVCATSAVLVSVFVSQLTGFNTDGIMGLVVSLLIAFAGINILKTTLSQLLGEAPDAQLINSIVEKIKSYDGVKGIHDLAVHNYGPDKYYASVHVEVDSAVPILDSHDVIDQIEKDFAENTNVTLVIHLDPIVIGDPELEMYREQIVDIVHQLDESFTIHDFRMVKGPTHTNLIFDIAIGFETKLTASHIVDYVQQEVHKTYPTVYVVPTVEKQL